MPELPEVQTVVTSVRPHVVGAAIDGVDVCRADVLRPADFDWSTLHGRSFSDVSRRGKKIVFTVEGADRFVIHLGMTGRLSVEVTAQARRPHTHAVFRLRSMELRFSDPRRFGGIWWLGTTETPDTSMGPEPIGLRSQSLARRLGRTKRAIKNALLDQSVIAGLGNIYVDESLHAAGIHPLAVASQLTVEQVGRLNRAIKSTLRRAIAHRGSTLRDYRDADGNAGTFQNLHRVYARGGKPCRHCRSTIEKLLLGGRSTHYCPICQPEQSRNE